MTHQRRNKPEPTEALVERVQQAHQDAKDQLATCLPGYGPKLADADDRFDAALTELTERLAAAKRERDHLRSRIESRGVTEAATQARAGAAIILNESLLVELTNAKEQLEALREALERIATSDFGGREGVQIARAALSQVREKKVQPWNRPDWPERSGL